MKQKLVFIDITNQGTISGVGRYLECLLDRLNSQSRYELYWIRMVWSGRWEVPSVEHNGHLTSYIIPMPNHTSPIISREFFMKSYCDVVWDIISDHFNSTDNLILHLHTLNAITLALKIKDECPNSYIISHLHCIPWKDKLNKNAESFNKLYKECHKSHLDPSDYIVSFAEKDSYEYSDQIVCVTNNAMEFLERVMQVPRQKLRVISNGIEDRCSVKKPTKRFSTKIIKLLYVGSIIPSKGIEYVAQAMRLLKQKGIRIELRIAGSGSQFYINQLKATYADVRIKFLGLLDFDQLVRQYRLCDIGVLVSLQEQCSYAAIEMAMFGMPIIVSAVDGLDEMFVDRVSCMKVPTVFCEQKGLRIYPVDLADAFGLLIRNTDMSDLLGRNARIRYLDAFTLDRMTQETCALYDIDVGAK